MPVHPLLASRFSPLMFDPTWTVTLQAHAMDLACRQFRAFDLETLTTDLRTAPWG